MIRCILAEDEQILRRGLIVTTDWESLGCVIIGEAENGQQALELVKRFKPDLIITDIRMPLLDGLELIRETQKICDAEFLIMSGYNDFDYCKEAITLGVTEYLCKPIDEDEFESAVSRVREKINKKRVHQQLISQVDISNNDTFIQFERSFGNVSSIQNQYVLAALDYIKENFSENISIKDVCKTLLISESYLSKLFKEHTSYSFVRHLANYRMRKACELLRDPMTRIYAVAEQVGYKDQRYFSTVFKKTTGLTPQEFREKLGIID